MEDEIHSGVLHHLKAAALGKKWTKKWAVLYKYSLYGQARLEVHDTRESFEKRDKNNRKHVTTISLENCSNVTDNTANEGKKNEYSIRLSFPPDEKQQVFNCDTKKEMTFWLQALRSVVFRGDSYGENDQVYEVEMKPSECTIKLNLDGVYLLSVSSDDIELVDKETRSPVIKWPLHLLRKYGRDKQEFSIEAGRRCPSGPGMFYFITDQYNEIFQEVESNVKSRASRSRAESTSSTSSLVKGTYNNKYPSSNDPVSSPPHVPPATSLYADPIDVRKNNSTSPTDDYTYNEPFQLRSPPHSKTKPFSQGGKNNLKQSKESTDVKKKPKRVGNTLKGPGTNSKKPNKKSQELVVEATYSEALGPNGTNQDLTSEYSRLNLGPGTALEDAAYDSISYPNQWSTAANLGQDNTYATADFPGKSNESSQPTDSVYDHVKR